MTEGETLESLNAMANANPIGGKVAKTGRPPVEADWPMVFELIRGGRSQRGACELLGLHQPTVSQTIASSPSLADQYALATALRGELVGESVLGIAAKVMDGTLTPEQGRVAIDAHKWAAGQMNPKRWGQSHTQATVTGPDGGALRIVISGADRDL